MEKPRTRPSRRDAAPRKTGDARIHAGADTNTGDEERAPEDLDPDVAENYEEMIERGADQRGEGRIP